MLIADVDSLHVKRNRLVGMNYLGIIDVFLVVKSFHLFLKSICV